MTWATQKSPHKPSTEKASHFALVRSIEWWILLCSYLDKQMQRGDFDVLICQLYQQLPKQKGCKNTRISRGGWGNIMFKSISVALKNYVRTVIYNTYVWK